MAAEHNIGLFKLLNLYPYSLLIPDRVKFPKNSSTSLDVNTIGDGYYAETLAFLQQEWSDKIVLIADTDFRSQGVTFLGHVRSYSHVYVDGLRYGAARRTRGFSARYAYIDNREPVQIEYILHAEQALAPTSTETLSATFAIVRRFVQDEDVPDMPWNVLCVHLVESTHPPWLIPYHVSASDLGAATWNANALGPGEFVRIDCLSGHLVLASLACIDLDLWVTVPFDHVSETIHLRHTWIAAYPRLRNVRFGLRTIPTRLVMITIRF
jgi:hypothetical protein